jgi:hypothetical protein
MSTPPLKSDIGGIIPVSGTGVKGTDGDITGMNVTATSLLALILTCSFVNNLKAADVSTGLNESPDSDATEVLNPHLDAAVMSFAFPDPD